MKRKSIIRAVTFTTGVALGLNLMAGAGFAAPVTPTNPHLTGPSIATLECSDSHHSNTGHGANNTGGYQSTCDVTDFGGNGQEFGPGLQTGKPCAGCVGNADDKNPPGQFPDGSDHNSGYECDGRDRTLTNQNGNGNHGIGDENPAHTGCAGTTVVTPPPPPVVQTCPDGSAMKDTNRDGFLTAADCIKDVVIITPAPKCEDGADMTDIDGNGVINSADCDKVVVEDEVITPAPKCDDESDMTDVDGNGVINSADCDKVVVEDEVITPAPKCDDESDMTDVDGNGVINSADCIKVVEETVVEETVVVDEVVEATVVEKVVVESNTVAPAPIVLAEVIAAPAPVVEAAVITNLPVEAAPVAVANTNEVAVLAAEFNAAPAVEPIAAGRSTKVLGVQVERGAAPLARTGFASSTLALIAGLLLALGMLLVRVGRRPSIA